MAWLVRLWLSRYEWKAHKELARTNHKPLYRRFNRFNRTLHVFMLVSFFTLALTGMALKFSYMGWAQGVAFLLGGFGTMGVLHRFGAVILFGIFVAHIWDVVRKKKQAGQTWLEVITGPDTILFAKRDIKDVIQSIRWFFGIGERPSYGRYTYWEKFDYFAVLWGIIIIGSTGLHDSGAPAGRLPVATAVSPLAATEPRVTRLPLLPQPHLTSGSAQSNL